MDDKLSFKDPSALVQKLRDADIPAVFPGSLEYSTLTKASNSRYRFYPVAVVLPRSADEVSASVRISSEVNYNVVARSGGHGGIANCLGGKDGSVVIDLQNLQGISIDLSTHLVTVEAGNRLGRIAKELNQHGRAIPHGTCPSVGIGGQSAYGGYGFTSRMWGLNLDAIESINTVLADGTPAIASSTENPDLFWALRGAAPSFGITTSITFRTYPAPAEVTYFNHSWEGISAGNSAAILDRWQSHFTSDVIPPHLGVDLILTATTSHTIDIVFFGGWFAPSEGFAGVLAAFLDSIEPPTTKKVITGTWLRALEEIAIDAGSDGLDDPHVRAGRMWGTSLMTPSAVNGGRLSASAVDSLSSWLAEEGTRNDLTVLAWFQPFGGTGSAVNDVPQGATSYGNRGRTLNIHFGVMGDDTATPLNEGDEIGYELIQDMKEQILNNMPDDWDYGSYVQDPDERLSHWQTRYYSSNYARLQELKAKYDPKGRFTFPLGIELPCQ